MRYKILSLVLLLLLALLIIIYYNKELNKEPEQNVFIKRIDIQNPYGFISTSTYTNINISIQNKLNENFNGSVFIYNSINHSNDDCCFKFNTIYFDWNYTYPSICEFYPSHVNFNGIRQDINISKFSEINISNRLEINNSVDCLLNNHTLYITLFSKRNGEINDIIDTKEIKFIINRE